MATLAQAVQFQISQLSSKIHDLKVASASNGPHINPKHPNWATYTSLKHKVSVALTSLAILKRCPIAKGSNIPPKGEVRKAMRADKNSVGIYAHSPKLKTPPGTEIHINHRYWRKHANETAQANSLVLGAHVSLVELFGSLTPEKHAEIDAWIKEKTNAREEARKAVGA